MDDVTDDMIADEGSLTDDFAADCACSGSEDNPY